MNDHVELMTDECLRGVVLLALSNDADLAPLDLRVGVLNGIVHLCGSAPTLALWESAGRVAGTVPGVRAVINRVCSPGAPHPIRTIHLDLFQKE